MERMNVKIDLRAALQHYYGHDSLFEAHNRRQFPILAYASI
jgi:hypothetical protein